MSESPPKEFADASHAEGASHFAKQEDDQALLLPIPRYLLTELPQYGEELPQYVEGVIETGKRRGELDKVWLRVISKESKALLSAGEDRTWNEIADFVNRVEPLESLFGGDPPSALREQIETFDNRLVELNTSIAAAQFSGGSQDDVDKLYNSLTVIIPALKVISGRCEQRADQILKSFDRTTVKIQEWVERARAALDAATADQWQANLEKMAGQPTQYRGETSTVMGERVQSGTAHDSSSAGVAATKRGESGG